VVIELAKREGLVVREAPVPLDALLSADEAFLTGSLKEITPLIAIDGSKIGVGSPGPLTRHLQQRYRAAVKEERTRGIRGTS
jgi:branched-subunit amino acid aminotransferase/4-amino-4-deoxychorismate lyase